MKRIVIDPNICHGKPTIQGTRVPISQVLGALSAGEKIEDLLLDYPNISREDVLAALELDDPRRFAPAWPGSAM